MGKLQWGKHLTTLFQHHLSCSAKKSQHHFSMTSWMRKLKSLRYFPRKRRLTIGAESQSMTQQISPTGLIGCKRQLWLPSKRKKQCHNGNFLFKVLLQKTGIKRCQKYGNVWYLVISLPFALIINKWVLDFLRVLCSVIVKQTQNKRRNVCEGGIQWNP